VVAVIEAVVAGAGMVVAGSVGAAVTVGGLRAVDTAVARVA